MPDLLRLLLIIVLLSLGFAAYFLVLNALFGNRIARTQNVINQAPGRALGVGLVNFLFFGVIATVLFSVSENTSGLVKGIVTMPALVITAFLAVLLSLGLTGMVNMLGEKIFPELSTWQRTVWSAVILSFACALPFVGWFLLLPYAGLVGFGAVILGFFQRDS